MSRQASASACSGHDMATAVLDFNITVYIGRAKNVSSGICGQRRPRSDCASAQSDQGLRCPLTDSLNTTECMNAEQRPC